MEKQESKVIGERKLPRKISLVEWVVEYIIRTAERQSAEEEDAKQKRAASVVEDLSK